MERLTRRSKVGEGLPIKHFNLIHENTTSEETLTEILDKLAEYEDTNLTPQNIICKKMDINFLQTQNKEYRKKIFKLREGREQLYNQMIQAQKDYQEVMTFLRNENKRLQNRIMDKELLQEG